MIRAGCGAMKEKGADIACQPRPCFQQTPSLSSNVLVTMPALAALVLT